MNQTQQTLLEQMRITEVELELRKTLFGFGSHEARLLLQAGGLLQQHIESIVQEFYRLQTSNSEIALLIGDADTLERLRNAQRRYVLDLFSGHYGLDYVNHRLRIGLVHKRIGVEPKLYLSAMQTLKQLITAKLRLCIDDGGQCSETLLALDKLMQFDITLVVDTYIRSLVSEIEVARDRSDRYARTMEELVRERTRQLEDLARTDALTGLLNVRTLHASMSVALQAAQRRQEALSLVFIDVNDFKAINDRQGHQRGDEVLRQLAQLIQQSIRAEDAAFRYGGDEFCILLTHCDLPQAEQRFVARLRERMALTLPGITISVGIAQSGPLQHLDANGLIRTADEAMYQQKQAQHLSHAAAQTLTPPPAIDEPNAAPTPSATQPIRLPVRPRGKA